MNQQFEHFKKIKCFGLISQFANGEIRSTHAMDSALFEYFFLADVIGEGAKKAQVSETNVQELHAQFGQLTMENDILEHGLERIHGPIGKHL